MLALLLAFASAAPAAPLARPPELVRLGLNGPAMTRAWQLTVDRRLEHGYVALVDAQGRVLERSSILAGTLERINLAPAYAELTALRERDAALRRWAAGWRDLHTHVPDPGFPPGFSDLDYEAQEGILADMDAREPEPFSFGAGVAYWDFSAERVAVLLRILRR